MANIWILSTILVILAISTQTLCDLTRVTSFDLMKCSYGERGSLTATCVNATPSYFKSTLYKFDHLDETLLCISCNLSSIEPNTFDLSGNQIRHLNISNSFIESLKQKAFMGLIFLEDLDLSYNKIRSVYPGTFNGAKKILNLDLTKNEISILSDKGFAELVNLEYLILRNNSIQTIAESAFEGLTNLKELDLSFNQIVEITNKLSNLTALQILRLNSNKLTKINRWDFYNLTNLNLLDLSNNYLIEPVIEMAPNNQLKTINLIHNEISTFWFPLVRLYALEELNLRENNIQEIEVYSLENLHNLRKLDLSYNSIQIIRTGLFTGLPQLRYLNCSHNNIEGVEITGVLSISSLHTLDLSYNNISDFDYNLLLARVPALSYLKLENNLLSCDLEDEMMKDFAEDNFKYVLYENTLGSVRCIEKPIKSKAVKAFEDAYLSNDDSSSAAIIVIFVLLAIAFAAIGILTYIQYLFYKGVNITLRKRVESNLQLISSDGEAKDEETNERNWAE